MIEKILESTQKYIESFPKKDRKNIGQFFTSISTARYMASKVHAKQKMRILDIGAGTGILSAALIEKLVKDKSVELIELVLYENDPKIIEVLKYNAELMKADCAAHHILLTIDIEEENFILQNASIWEKDSNGEFDVVISNPPYKKIGKDSEESKAMSSIVYGQPNMYFLCMAIGEKLLKDNGDFLFIVPRSWTSGLYFKKFRSYFLKKICLKSIHLFISRDKVFDQESVLQETMIIYGTKTNDRDPFLTITSSKGTNDFTELHKLSVPRELCITNDENHFLLLPTCKEDVDALNFMSDLSSTLRKEGFLFKTGQVVEFRNKEDVCKQEEADCIPMICPFHIQNGFIKFPVETQKNQFLRKNNKTSLYMENKNMLLLKRFTSKEESRRLQVGLYLLQDSAYPEISIENHVNYLAKKEGVLELDELYGLWTILSSDMWDRYYRILNGSTQVNAEEINAMPVPDIATIRKIGKRIQLESQDKNYDKVIEEIIHEQD